MQLMCFYIFVEEKIMTSLNVRLVRKQRMKDGDWSHVVFTSGIYKQNSNNKKDKSLRDRRAKEKCCNDGQDKAEKMSQLTV
jgi:hypothetical protein